jgi:hypothetical protein
LIFVFFSANEVYLICCRHSTAEAKQASFVVGKTYKKKINDSQRGKLSFATIKINDPRTGVCSSGKASAL